MKREINLAELIGFTIIILTGVFGFWLNTNVRLAILENDSKNMKEYFLELKADTKEIKSNQERMLIEIQNKRNRDEK